MPDPQDRSLLYLRTRAALRAIDPRLSVHALACLTRAIIRDGIAHISRDGHVAFLCPRSPER